MFNNRKYINELKYHNEKLTEAKEWFRKSSRYWQETSHEKSKEITNLKKDIESKENSVCNLLEANKELSQHNNFLENQNLLLNKENAKLTEEMKVLKKERDSYKELHKKEYENFEKAYSLARKHRDKISMLEKVIRKHEENECRLNQEKCRTKGQLDKLRNVYKMQTGIDILEGEE